jgi:hypothetical protein
LRDWQHFQFRKFIETSMADVHGRPAITLPERSFRLHLRRAGVGHHRRHRLRKRIGRAQLQYLTQLAERADYRLDPARIRGGSGLRLRAMGPTTSSWLLS